MIRRLTQSVKDRWLRFKGHDESPAKRREMRFEAMEDRILLSADFGIEPQTSQFDSGLLAHAEIAIVDIDQQYDEAKTAQSLAAADAQDASGTGVSDLAIATGNTTGDNLSREAERQTLVIVDSSVPDYSDLIQQIPADGKQTLAILDADANGIDQITDILAEHRNMDTVYILSHGSDGALRLGNSWLDSTDLSDRAEQVKTWGEALSPEGDIMLYGCNVAAGADGIAFVGKLAELTSADVAASSDNTGDSALGGDWDLEYQVGSVEASPLIDPSGNLTIAYNFLLDDMTGTADGDTLTSNAGEDDTLTGLDGDDTFAFQDAWGQDVVIEGTDEGMDTLDFSDVTVGLVFRISGTDGSVTVTDGTNTVTATNIENLIGGSGNDTFILEDSATLAGTINGWYGDNTLDHGLYTTTVDVDLALGLATGMGSFSFIQNFVSGTGVDTISGSGGNNIWTIDGDNSGTIGSGNADDTVTFSGFENLTGAEDNEDTFLLKETGNVDGTLSGGRDGVDRLLVESGSDTLIFNPDVTGAGSMVLSGRTIVFDGLEPVISTTEVDAVVTAIVINAGILDDHLTLEDTSGVPESLTLTSLDPNIRFLQSDGSETDALSFTTPTETITINLKSGDDAFILGATGFSGQLEINGDTGSDTLTGADNVNTWVLEDDDSGTLNTSIVFAGFENLAGGDDADELRGSEADSAWIIDGADAGTVNGILAFAGMETLTGAADNEDTFVFETAGSLSGSLSAGDGGHDSLIIKTAANTLVVHDTDGQGTAAGFDGSGRVIAYAGLELFVDATDPDETVITATIFEDDLVLEDADAGTPGEMQIRSQGYDFLADGSQTDTISFNNPTNSITVNLKAGEDTFRIASLDPAFAGTVSVNGGADTDLLTGANTDNTWEITGNGEGTLNAHAFSGFENLTGGTATDTFRVLTDGSLDGDDGIIGGGGTDILEGSASAAGNVWIIEGADAGRLNDIHFSGVADLVGADDTNDAFFITSTGDISGSVSGGAGGIDGLKIETTDGDMLLVAPEASGTGNAAGFDGSGRSIGFSGLEPIVDNADVSNIRINAGQAEGQLILEDDPDNPGSLRLRSQDMNFLTATEITDVLAVGTPTGSVTLTGPDDGELALTHSLTLNNGDLSVSADTITVAAGVILATRLSDVDGNALNDAGDITISGRIITIGGNAQLLAGVEEDSTFTAGDILLTATNVAETPWIQLGYDSRDAIITIGTSAILTGGNLTITATAGDTAPEELDDAFLTILENYSLGVLQTLLTDNLSLPLVAMVKNAEARVDIGENAQLIASGDIEISSDATADGTVKAITGGVNPFSAVPVLNIFSVAYSQADATAETLIKDNVQISAGGDIYIDSAASAKASATARTSANLGYFPSNRDAMAISVAVANSHTTAHAVISQGAVIGAGGNINVTAMGTSENVASAEVGVYENGLAGVSVALGFANNDIKAEVNGSLTAQGSTTEPVPDPETGEGDTWGIGINATLTNKMVTSAVSGLRGEPLIKDALLKGEVAPDLGKIITGTLQKTRDSNKHTNFFSPDSFLSTMSIAGAVAYAHENSDVTAKVGASGDLKSMQDIVVASTVEDRVQTVAESVIADQAPDPGKTEKDSAISVAVIVGEYDNHATALVESNAVLMAGRNIEVDSEITYPFFTEPSEAYSADDLKSPAAIGTLLDQKLGVQSKLFNSWARSVGQGGPLGFGFSWDSMNFTNTAEAVIESGAQINQADPDGPYSDYLTDDQSVTVNAATAMELVDMAGVFDINLQASTIQELKDKGDSLGNWLQLQGAKGDSVGLGGSVLWRQTDNQTIARIEDADIHIGESGTLTVSADSHMTAIGLAQSGSGGKYSINGTVAYIDHDSLTLALLQPGVTVNGGALNITATDDSLFGTLAGSAMKGENIGVGISVAITDMSRTTYAAISAASFDADTGRIISLDPDAVPTDNGTSITVDGDITITATSTGQIGGFAIAAGQLAESKKEPANENQKEAGDASDNADVALENKNADSNDKKNQGSYGIGISGDAAVSTITDWNRAFINDQGTLTADTLTLTAESTTGLISIAGAVLVNTRDNSLGIAGSYGQNTLNSITQAFIRGASLVNVANLRLYAHRNGDIYAFTAGGVGAKKKDTINVAGSVSINDIDSETTAFIEESMITTAGDVEVIALDESEILAVAGAVAYGGKAGIGASVSLNSIKTVTGAVVSDSTIEDAALVKLSATNKNEIESIAGSIGISPNNLGVAGTVAINEINALGEDESDINSVEASIKNSTIPEYAAVGVVRVEAVDASRIFSIAGQMALGKSFGLGAAVAYNEIGNKTKADVDGSVINAEQTVTVKAASASEIETVSVGVSGGKTLGVSGSVSLNTINNITSATIGNQSDISADNGVTLTANDSWTDEAGSLHATTIKADAGGFGLAASGGKDSSTSIAVGISFAINEITNSLSAVVDNASMTTENDISMTAASAVTIDALTIGGAGALATGSGTNLAFSGAGAGSGNTIANTVEVAVKNNSTITADNNAVTLTATDTSTIIADAGGVALAVGTSGNKTAGALSIGASIADNEITNSTSAYIDGGTVAQAGDVTVSAQSTSRIDALTFGGAAAVGASGKATGVALSGAGAGSYNTITNTIEAYVKNVAFPNGAGIMTISAIDSATIISDAIGAAASVGASSSGTGVGLAVGVSIAENDIGNTTKAYIEDTVFPEGEDAESLSISAVATGSIQSLSISATLSVGAAKTTGVALSGGGSSSDNFIHTQTHAYAEDCYLVTTGDMALQAANTSVVTAKVFTVSASVAASGDNAVAASIGASMAHNAIGWDSDDNYAPLEVKAYLQDTGISSGGSLLLNATSGQTINAVVMAGSVAIAASKGVGVGLAGSGVNAENSISTIVRSYITGDGTQGISAAEIGLSARDISVIISDAGAASLAASFAGDAAISLSIGVALADNFISNNISAHITNADSVRATGGEIRLEAFEAAGVDALAVAASLAVGVSPKGFALSLSGAGADAVNTIANQVTAYVSYSTVETTAPAEGFAEAFADYTATDTVPVLHNGDRVLVESEAAGETSSDIYEYIGADDLLSVDLAAQNYSDAAKWRLYGPDIVINAASASGIHALVGAASVSISVGSTAAAGAFGVSLAKNNIGVIGDYPLLNQVLAYADHSTLISAQDIDIHATSINTVSAVSFAGAVAVAVGSTGISVAGTGAELTNTVSSLVHAYIAESDVDAAGDIDIKAYTYTDILEAGVVGAAIALSLAPSGVAVSVAVSLSDNTIANDVQAYISGSSDRLVEAVGDISVTADTVARISDAYAVTASVSVGYIAAAGGGIEINNTIVENVDAYISGMTVASLGDVTVYAKENAYLNGDATAVTVAIGLGGALGVALLTNQINSDISASVNDATVVSDNSVISANSRAEIAETTSTGISGGLVAAAANRADADIATLVEAFASNAVLVSSEDVSIIASVENINRADTQGGALGAIAVGAMIADVTLGRGEAVDEVVAAADEGTIVSARTLYMTAVSSDDLLAESIAGGGGVVAAAGAESDVTSDNATLVKIGDNVDIHVTSLMVNSTHSQDIDTSADSYAIALAAGSGAGASNLITGKAGVDIGAATVTSKNIVITSKNVLTKDKYKDSSNLRSGSASAGNVTVMESGTDIGTEEIPFEAVVNIGAGARLTVEGDQDSPGVFRIEAQNEIVAMDSVRVESVSGFGVSVGISRIYAYTNAAVNLDGAILESNAGDIYLTARTDSSINPSANLLAVSAVSGAAGATADGETHAKNAININSSGIKGSDIYLFAGQDSFGVPNLLDSFANTEISTVSVGPSIGAPFPYAEIYETNLISVSGTQDNPSSIKALEDVTLATVEGLGGAERARTEGMTLCIGVPPYGFNAPDGALVTSTNTVMMDGFSTMEAGINNQSVVHILPVMLNGEIQLSPDRIGDLLTDQEKEDLGLVGDIQYEYAALNLDSISVNITPGDVVLDADTGNYYRYTGPYDFTSGNVVPQLRQGDRVKTEADAEGVKRGEVYAYIGSNRLTPVNLAAEDYSDGTLWIQITDPSVDLVLTDQAYTDTAIWEQLLPGEISDEMAYVRSDATEALQESLEGKFYVIKPKSMNDVTLSLKNVGTMLLEQREKILGWMVNHAANNEAVARYAVQLAVLDQTLDQLGLFETITLENGDTVTVINNNLDALFVQLPDIYAAPGSIFIESDISNQAFISSLANTQLTARAGANIQVVNETPFSMVVNDAIIRDNRKVSVTDEGVYTVLAPGAIYFNNIMIPGTGQNAASDTSEITITQPIIPDNAYDLGDLTIPALDQDIYIAGKVRNEAGDLTIVNQEGSIHVTGEIRADHVNIQAAKDFNLTTEDWFHTGRDPRQYINYDIYRALSRILTSPLTYALDTDVQGLSQALSDDSSAILAQGNIAVSARYLNIDGLVQSGAQTITLTIDEDFAPGKTTSLLGNDGKAIDGVSFGPEGVPVEAIFDAEKQAIVVSEIVPTGGSIILAGQIFSTGNGRIQVAHGYADVDITNNSSYSLIVNRIDTTKDREGIITIVDTSRLQKTVYAVTDSLITETVYQGQAGTEVTQNDGVISAIVYEQTDYQTYTQDELVEYYPQEGLRYLWTEGQEFTRVVVTKYEQNSFNLFGFDWDALSKDASYTWRKITYRDQIPLLESEVLVIDVLPEDGQTSGVTYILSPDYTVGMAYSIDYELRTDLDVDIIPGDIVKVADGHTAGGTPGDRYAYVGESMEVVLSEQDYEDEDFWDNVTGTTTDTQVTYASDYINSSKTTQTWTTGGGWLRKKTHHTKTTETTGELDFYTHTLKADYPIEIDFLGGSEFPEVSLRSGGDLYLQGDIHIPDSGAIALESFNGSVISGETTAVFDVSPEVNAGNEVFLNVEGGIGPLNIHAGGNIQVNPVYNPLADDPNNRLWVGEVNSAAGDVFLTAPGGIFAVDGDALISGDLVELYSGNNGIGTAELSIRINSDVAGEGGLAAKSSLSIFIQETSGDLKLAEPESWKNGAASVESLTGDVTLEALSGSVLDAYYENFTAPSETDAANLDEIQDLTGEAALAAAMLSIRSEESAQTQAYHDYWINYRNAMPDAVSMEISMSLIDADTDEIHFNLAHSLSSGDQVVISIEDNLDSPRTNLQNGFTYFAVVINETTIQLALNRYDAVISETPVVLNITMAETGNFELMKVQEYTYTTDPYDPDMVLEVKYQAIHDTYGDGSYDPNFIFQLSDSEKAERLNARSFSSDVLNYPMSRDLFSYLYPDAEGAVTPNTEIAEYTNVKANNVVLRALGAGGQVGRTSGVVFIDLSQGYDALTPDRKKILSLATIEDIISVDRDTGGELTGLTLEVWNDINVETGSIRVSAADSVALQSDGEMMIDHVAAGGAVRLQAGGAVTDLYAHDETAVAAGGDVTLLATNPDAGVIGTMERRFRIDVVDPAVFTARAGTVVYVLDMGDLYLGTVTAPLVDFLAQGSIFDGNADDDANLIAANTLILHAEGGIGSLDNDVDFDYPDSEVWVLDVTAEQSIYMAEANGPLVVGDNFSILSSSGDVSLTVTDRAGDEENLRVSGTKLRAVFSLTGSVSLRAGDDLVVENNSLIEAAQDVVLYADFGNADAGIGGTVTVLGPIAAAGVQIYGETDDDAFVLSNVIYTDTQPAPLWRLDGGEGSDAVILNLVGEGKSEIQVADSGLTGSDSLTVNSTEGDDTFLFRREYLVLLRPDGVDGQGKAKYDPDFERIYYDDTCDHLTVNSGEGIDLLAFDDNGVETTVNTGAGADVVNIGQMFRSAPEGVETLETTMGYLSNGVGYATVVNAGEGDDSITVYRNLAELELNGEDGDDTFIVRAFAKENTSIIGGDGSDTIEYAVNAPVDINGGDGLDHIFVIGTEQPDTFAVTANGVYGAGIHNTFEGVEYLTVDGYIGDDTFYILGTADSVGVGILGSYGNDTLYVGGAPEGTDLDALIITDSIFEYAITNALASIAGPLSIEGGFGESGARPINNPVNMPGQGEDDASYSHDELVDGLNEEESQDRLFVYDTAETEDSQGLLTDDRLTGFNMGDGTVIGEAQFPAGFGYVDFEEMTLALGSGNDQLDIYSTHMGETTILTNAGDDTVNAGGPGFSASGMAMDGISGLLTVDGGTGENVLNVDDTGDAKDNLGTLTGSSLTGLGMAEGIRYFQFAELNIGLGSGHDLFNIQGTMATTVIQGNDGNEIFNVSSDTDHLENGSLDFIIGELVLQGGAGSHTLNVSDYGDPDADADVVITRDTITGLAPVTLTYESPGGFAGGVDILLGQGSDHVRITSTREDSVTTLRLNTGDDQVTLEKDASGQENGLVIIFGEDGDDTIETAGLNDWTSPLVLFGDYGTVAYGSAFLEVYAEEGNGQVTAAEPVYGQLPEKSIANLFSVYTTQGNRGGNDVLSGGSADDILVGGAGRDVLKGNVGNDILQGDGGKQTFMSGRIRSTETHPLFTGKSDELFAGPGQDVLMGGAGHDYFYGNMDEDILIGDYGRMTWTSQGTVESLIRLGQGSLDLISKTQFGIYATDRPLDVIPSLRVEIKPVVISQATELWGEAKTHRETGASMSHHGDGIRTTVPTVQADVSVQEEGEKAALISFKEAFAKARSEGKRHGDTFEWNGRLYDAGLPNEKPAEGLTSPESEIKTNGEDTPKQNTPEEAPDSGDGKRSALEMDRVAIAGLMGWQWTRSGVPSPGAGKMAPQAFAHLNRKMKQRQFKEWTGRDFINRNVA